MTIKNALSFGVKQLNNSKTPALDTEVLLCYILKKDKAWLYSHQFNILTSDRTRRYQKLIFRRQKGEPIAYLTHHKEFYGLDFYVDKNVLIPRPETELIVEEALAYCSSEATYNPAGILPGEARTKNLRSSRPEASNDRILDLGTGSGNIVITLAKNIEAEFYAIDISQEALKIARKNVLKHKVKVNFIKSNLFDNIPKNLKFDLIIANLPYLDPRWIGKDLKFEPQKALDGNKNGLKIIKEFLKQVKNYLNKKSTILIEIDPRQIDKIKKLVNRYLPHKKVVFKKDLQGLIRIAIIF